MSAEMFNEPKGEHKMSTKRISPRDWWFWHFREPKVRIIGTRHVIFYVWCLVDRWKDSTEFWVIMFILYYVMTLWRIWVWNVFFNKVEWSTHSTTVSWLNRSAMTKNGWSSPSQSRSNKYFFFFSAISSSCLWCADWSLWYHGYLKRDDSQASSYVLKNALFSSHIIGYSLEESVSHWT